MSIYASVIGLDHEHEGDCAVWMECESGCFEVDETRACTCGLPFAPLAYAGSHVLPSDDDPKAPISVETAYIPEHIERDDRRDVPEGTPKPWLRLSVYGPGADHTCILTRRHVERLHRQFGEWLKQFEERGEQG